MSKVIMLVACALATHVHAIEHDASGNFIASNSVRFVSSDETLFTVSASAENPMAAELSGHREGTGVLSVYDADDDTLHVSYDVVISPAVAVDIELDTESGEKIDPHADDESVGEPHAEDDTGEAISEAAPAPEMAPVYE